MVIWSALRPLLTRPVFRATTNGVVQRTMSDHRVFPFQPSRWQWNKFKDLFHFYVMLGVIPVGLIITASNVFVGPATLSEIPEDYTPKYWEYYRHPITRFIARYMLNNPQQDYEKFLHNLFEESERVRLRELETKIKQLMEERKDYQAYYYQPILAKYHRMSRDAAEYVRAVYGE